MSFDSDRELGREYRICGRLVRVTGHEPGELRDHVAVLELREAVLELLDVHGLDRRRYHVPVTWWQTGLAWGVIAPERPTMRRAQGLRAPQER